MFDWSCNYCVDDDDDIKNIYIFLKKKKSIYITVTAVLRMTQWCIFTSTAQQLKCKLWLNIVHSSNLQYSPVQFEPRTFTSPVFTCYSSKWIIFTLCWSSCRKLHIVSKLLRFVFRVFWWFWWLRQPNSSHCLLNICLFCK